MKLINGMTMTLFPWQPRCALVSGVGNRSRYSQETHLDLRVKRPFIRPILIKFELRRQILVKLLNLNCHENPSNGSRCVIRLDIQTLANR
jgi:hypothetical protein